VISLLDVNTLLALAWPNHVHHEAAQRWFAEHRTEGWATCSITQTGFVRVSSNTGAIVAARSPQEAIHLLADICALPHHVFWNDDLSIADRRWVAVEKLVGHRQVTDAQLLGLAIKRGGRLATFDRAIRALVPSGADAAKVVHVLTVTATG
jgi:toxin-antitoxin system PIN domain toxin